MTLAKDQDLPNRVEAVRTQPEVQTEAQPAIVFPPGDLYSDEPPLESDLHRDQINLLI